MDIFGQTISQTTNTVGDLNNDFSKYSNNNSLIVVAAAVCIGIATKEIIERLMNEVVLPVLQIIVNNSLYYWVYKFLLKSSVSSPFILNILNGLGTVAWLFLLWSVIVFVSFVLFKKLLDRNIISSQLGFIHKLGQYAATFDESVTL